MKTVLRGIMAALAIVVSAVCAWGEGSPVVLTHTLIGYSRADKAVTLEYAVQVQNRENSAVGPLSLSLVPHPPFIVTKTTVTVDSIGPKETASFNVKVVTPLLLDEKHFLRKHLPWAGRCTTADGKVVEFPIKSKPGGDK